jgi:signal transduction histidine kinase
VDRTPTRRSRTLTTRSALLAAAGLALAATLFASLLLRQLDSAAMGLVAEPELVELLETAQHSTRRLADLDPENHDRYRERFDALQQMRGHLQILQQNRQELIGRYRLLVILVFAACTLLATGALAYRQSRDGPRLERLRQALENLAQGQENLRVEVGGRDLIGRIAGMIEATSRAVARDRRRLAELKNLSAWQEAARRHAHEMRTPLTAAKLEIQRIGDLPPALAADGETTRQAAGSALEELDRLGDFVQRFTSFARLPDPRRVRCELRSVVEDFAATYASVWPHTTLLVAPALGPDSLLTEVLVDRDMLRQVLVNLCENAAQAAAGQPLRIELSLERHGNRLSLEVRDDGPGVAAEIRERLFEPYVTTRTIGHGMGLGLAIAKKILLDHEGDLDLVETSARGTCFRLVLPASQGRAV